MSQIIAASAVALTGKLFWIDSEEFVPEIFTDDEDSWLFLDPDDRLILAMICPVILQGVLVERLSGEILLNFLHDFDHALTVLTESQQSEFQELLSLLKSLLGRVLVADIWTSWNNVSQSSIDKMLNNWRDSFIDLLKIAYKGLKELTFATWYGNPENWHGIGYPGPPEIGR